MQGEARYVMRFIHDTIFNDADLFHNPFVLPSS